MRLAQRELDIVREQQPVAADLIFERQRLSLELDFVFAGNIRPHVQVRRLLHIRMPELEDDFRIANGEPVLIRDAPPQDEGIVVETEFLGIEEYNLPHPWLQTFEMFS